MQVSYREISGGQVSASTRKHEAQSIGMSDFH